jgi:hypothetical protein
MKNKNKRELEKLWAKQAREKAKPPKTKTRPAATPASASGNSGTVEPAKDAS